MSKSLRAVRATVLALVVAVSGVAGTPLSVLADGSEKITVGKKSVEQISKELHQAKLDLIIASHDLEKAKRAVTVARENQRLAQGDYDQRKSFQDDEVAFLAADKKDLARLQRELKRGKLSNGSALTGSALARHQAEIARLQTNIALRKKSLPETKKRTRKDLAALNAAKRAFKLARRKHLSAIAKVKNIEDKIQRLRDSLG